MNENKFWISFWVVLFSAILLVIFLGVINGYLNDKQTTEALSYEKALIAKDLQPYTISTCNSVSTSTELHESGWKQSSTIAIPLSKNKGIK